MSATPSFDRIQASIRPDDEIELTVNHSYRTEDLGKVIAYKRTSQRAIVLNIVIADDGSLRGIEVEVIDE